jgi:hypothetical protein
VAFPKSGLKRDSPKAFLEPDFSLKLDAPSFFILLCFFLSSLAVPLRL